MGMNSERIEANYLDFELQIDPGKGREYPVAIINSPAVIAMQYEITDRAAVEFARTFYEVLAEGLPLVGIVYKIRWAIRVDALRPPYQTLNTLLFFPFTLKPQKRFSISFMNNSAVSSHSFF